jgi:putative membrane protein
MTRAAFWLLAAGVLLFVVVLVSHDASAVFATLALAGWGVLGVTAFHLLPLALDAAAIRILQTRARGGSTANALLVRWIGESANSLMPAGQIGGPLLMIRQLIQRGVPTPDAAAAITASTTLQTVAQIVFALLGLALLGGRASLIPLAGSGTAAVAGGCVLTLMIAGFYLLQRRGLFGKLTRLLQRVAGRRDWSGILKHAEAIDLALQGMYSRSARVTGSFALSLLGWVAGTGEVWLICRLLDSPVSWGDALILESLGQTIRSVAFAVPGSLGVQEGGYVLLAPLAGLRPEVALALSLAKRARELLLAIPGLIYLHFSERAFRRRAGLATVRD